MILGHRLSELCGHGPNLETDIALTNISLDLFGQVRNYFQYAAELRGGDSTEDSIAMLRYAHEYRNALLVEQPNTDFAYVIGRQFLFDAFHLPLLSGLAASRDERLAAIAAKSVKEVKYHFRFSSAWIKRLGDGTVDSHARMQKAIDDLWTYVPGLFADTDIEHTMRSAEISPDMNTLKSMFSENIENVFREARLRQPHSGPGKGGSKQAIHSEHLGYILSELQYMQRTYPNMSW